LAEVLQSNILHEGELFQEMVYKSKYITF